MGTCLQIRNTEILADSDRKKATVENVGSGIFLLSVSGMEDGRRKGQLKHLYCEEPFYFSDLTEAVLKMEEILDDAMPLPPVSAIRSLEKTAKKELPIRTFSKMAGENRKGQKELFYIQVYYRQHYSWQGEVRWQNGKQKMCFRSVLELLKLLDSALCPS